MDLYNVIIVGSGPAGTFSAYALRGKNPLVLDVGYRAPKVPPLEGNLYDIRRKRDDLFSELIGTHFESLHNLHKRTVSLKLKSPRMSYVIRNWEQFSPTVSSTFEGVISFAQGGLANAWGAGVNRFNDRDLQAFPIRASDLRPYYDELTQHIGISGENDELTPYFGQDPFLLPPIRMTRLAAEMLQRYRNKKHAFEKLGITIGRARLAVLTRPRAGRCAYKYENLEFYQPYDSAIYNPVFTLDDLVANRLVELQTGWFVTRYRELSDRVEVIARNVETGIERSFYTKRLLLAAGTLSTAKIVLTSNGDFKSRLPILDNWMVCIPLFRLDRIGTPLDVNDGALGQLNLIYDAGPSADLLQAGIYGVTGPLRSDILFQLPLSISANLTWAKYLAPAMTLVMVFGPGKADPNNYLQLMPDGKLKVEYGWKPSGSPQRKIIRAFRKIGYLSAPALCQYPASGSSMHYAGTLPMTKEPGRYQTDADGRLFGTRHVYVTDGACFSDLPAKNLTLTIMANAMRIARKIGSDFG